MTGRKGILALTPVQITCRTHAPIQASTHTRTRAHVCTHTTDYTAPTCSVSFTLHHRVSATQDRTILNHTLTQSHTYTHYAQSAALWGALPLDVVRTCHGYMTATKQGKGTFPNTIRASDTDNLQFSKEMWRFKVFSWHHLPYGLKFWQEDISAYCWKYIIWRNLLWQLSQS